MKSLMPWVCMAAAIHGSDVFADEGLDAYRLGHYDQAAILLKKSPQSSPIADYYLAQMRLYGYGELKNDVIAVNDLKKAAEKNLLPAQQLLARYELLKNHRYDQALAWFKKAADANDTDAQMYCAAAYLFGLGVSKNQDIAKRYYIAAAKNGNPLAQYTVALSFLETRNISNNKLGLLWLVKASDQGFAPAQALLAGQYIEGRLVEKDLQKAKDLLDQAIAKNEPSADYQMGQLERAQNHPEDALKWYEKAATPTGYVPALLAISSMYLEEKSPNYDPHKAFMTTLKAAQLDSREAQLALVNFYKKGIGIEANEMLAKEWLQKSSSTPKLSFEHAQQKAVLWLTNGKESLFEKTVYALPGILGQWQNQRVAQQNNYNAYPKMASLTREMLFQPQFELMRPTQIPLHEFHDMLVKLTETNTPTVLSFPQYMLYALSTADRASKLTSVSALNNMASSGSSEHQALFKKLEQQAILGNASAQFDLAMMYQYGIGVEKNAAQALKFYQLAAAQQDLQAEYNLGLMYLTGHDITPDYKQAIDWLTDAAFKGNDYAQYALAQIYDYGYRDSAKQEVIPADLEKAMAMYNLAAANGSGFAQYRLAEILVRQNHANMDFAARQKQNNLIKQLYTNAAAAQVKEAQLPLAFYDAVDPDKQKQQHAFDIAKQAAESGNQEAALLLGLMYDRGIAVEASQSDALEWYQKAKDNPIGAFMIGTYTALGIGGRVDLEQSQGLLKQAADKGFPYAYLNLAVILHRQEKPFLPDLNQAMALGNAPAGILLADYYLQQFKDNENLIQARKIYQEFAQKGDKNAQMKLGFLFEHGIGGSVDWPQAQQWYTAAAEQQLPEAQYLLARFYQLGQVGGSPDYVSAKKWYAAASSRYVPAALGLGFIYDTVDENYAKASEIYQQAMDKGNLMAAYNLGLIYERGEGRSVDYEKAQTLYMKAVEQDSDNQAMVQIAGIYLDAPGKLNDVDEAVHWYQKAAAKGNRDAMYQLGLMSETGVGVKRDYTDAVQYYERSSDRGDVKATLALARLYQYGVGVKQDLQKAGQLYAMLSDQGNPYAQYQLALFCFKGIQCQPEQAKQWLVKSKTNGSLDAARVLQRLNAETQAQVSFIEPMLWVASTDTVEDVSASRLYLDALNAWNLGDELTSKAILAQILHQEPDNEQAKQAFEQLQHADVLFPTVTTTKNTASLK